MPCHHDREVRPGFLSVHLLACALPGNLSTAKPRPDTCNLLPVCTAISEGGGGKVYYGHVATLAPSLVFPSRSSVYNCPHSAFYLPGRACVHSCAQLLDRLSVHLCPHFLPSLSVQHSSLGSAAAGPGCLYIRGCPCRLTGAVCTPAPQQVRPA